LRTSGTNPVCAESGHDRSGDSNHTRGELEALMGGCLCGAVGYALNSPAFAGFCHCTDCQRFSGSGRLPFIGAARQRMKITGPMTSFAMTSGRATITRHFCARCGSPVATEPGSAPGFVIVYAGTLHEPDRFRPKFSQFTRSGCKWSPPDPRLPSYPAAAPQG